MGPGPQPLLYTAGYHSRWLFRYGPSVSHTPGPCNRGLRGKNYYESILQMRKSRLRELLRALLIPRLLGFWLLWAAVGGSRETSRTVLRALR